MKYGKTIDTQLHLLYDTKRNKNLTQQGGTMGLLNVKDLEERSKISRYTWRTWIRQGRLPIIRAGRLVRVDERDYETFIASCRTEKTEAR